MNKSQTKKIKNNKKLSKVNENQIITENIIEDIGKFLNKVSGPLAELPVIEKLKSFYEKAKTSVGDFVKDFKEKISDDENEVLGDDESRFKKVSDKIIDNIEGGYYHPSFKEKGAKTVSGDFYPASSFDVMGDSGETMFGLDRKHGGKLNQSADGIEFWSIIDDAQKNEGRWAYEYRGGTDEQKLRTLVAKILYEEFKKNSEKYLNPEAKKIVFADNKLYFQFAYATWNGSRYFQKFSNAINKEVENGVTNPEELYDTVVEARHNSGQSNRKIAKIDKVISSYA